MRISAILIVDLSRNYIVISRHLGERNRYPQPHATRLYAWLVQNLEPQRTKSYTEEFKPSAVEADQCFTLIGTTGNRAVPIQDQIPLR